MNAILKAIKMCVASGCSEGKMLEILRLLGFKAEQIVRGLELARAEGVL